MLSLPSLPHDDELKIFQNFGRIINENIKFYQCRNGHYYSIGNCLKAISVSRCPTCKTQIGGTKYQLAEGNKEAEGLKEKTEYGYCVSLASDRQDKPETFRNMGFLNTSIIRLLLDCSLYLSSLESEKSKDLLSDALNTKDQDNLSYFYSEHVSNKEHYSSI